LLEFDSIENKYKHTLLDTDYKLLWSFVELCGENEYQLDELWLDDDNQIVETVYQNAVFPYRCPLNKPFIYSARWTINNEFRCVLNVSKILVKPTKRMTVLGKKQSVIRFEAKEKSTIINPNGEIKNIGGNGNIWTTYALGMGLVNMQLRDDKNKIVYHINLIKIYRGAEIDIEAEKAKNKTNKKL
jgi:hypothetical protein